MPSHYGSPKIMKSKNPGHMMIEVMKDGKKKMMKLPDPMMKPKSMLSKGQKELMSEHKEHHTKEHMNLMKKLMLKGYCFQQAHDITMKAVGK